MINWKTFIGASLFIISGVEFLTIKDHYHLAKTNPSLIGIGGLFLLTIITAILLIVQGLRRNAHS